MLPLEKHYLRTGDQGTGIRRTHTSPSVDIESKCGKTSKTASDKFDINRRRRFRLLLRGKRIQTDNQKKEDPDECNAQRSPPLFRCAGREKVDYVPKGYSDQLN